MEAKPYANKGRSLREVQDAIRKVVRVAFVGGIVLFFLAISPRKRLPGPDALLEDLLLEPGQWEVDLEPFEVEVRDTVYTITPLYEYELFGLIVSCHDSRSWWDLYHKKWGDNLNLKDLCVIWGANATNDAYQRIKFSSGSWTCYCQTGDRQAWGQFDIHSLSNNHLLSENKEINKVLLRARRGDQIRLYGYLAEYAHRDGTFKRGTSTTRTDEGNGACETIYLEEFEILKRSNVFWHWLHAFSKLLLLGSAVAWAVLFFNEVAASSGSAGIARPSRSTGTGPRSLYRGREGDGSQETQGSRRIVKEKGKLDRA